MNRKGAHPQKEKPFEKSFQEKVDENSNSVPAWNSSTSLKPGYGLGRLGLGVNVDRKPWNKSYMSNGVLKGTTIANVPWNNKPVPGSHKYVMPSVQKLRELEAKMSARSKPEGIKNEEDVYNKNVEVVNGFGRVTFSAGMYSKGHDYDEDEEEEPTLGQIFGDPSDRSSSKLSTDGSSWPKLPIVTKIELARRRRVAIFQCRRRERMARRPRPTGFTDLMPHIRYKILNYIPTAERVKLQLLCSEIRDDIRFWVGTQMYVDEETDEVTSFMRDLMVDTVVVGNYRQPLLRPRELVLRWYDTLHLKFVGAISIPYMDSFVGRCRGVRRITVTGEVNERPPIPNDPEKKRDYKSWRKVELVRRLPYALHYCKLLQIFPKGGQPHLSVKCALEVCHAVNIVKLKVVIATSQKINDTRTMYKAILKFIEEHHSLKDLWVDTKVIPVRLPKIIGKECLIPERDLRTMSRNCKLRRVTILEDNVNFYSWPCFLSEQKHLQVLQVLHRMLGSVYFSIIESNSSTLTRIAIHVMLAFNYHDQDHENKKIKYLDLKLFKNCHSLKNLYIRLSRSPKHPEGWWNNQLINFIGLPGSLEVLALQDVTFFNSDFLDIPGKLKRLKSLGVVFPKDSKQCVFVDREFLGQIFWMRSLRELLFHGASFTDDMIVHLDQFRPDFGHLNPVVGSVLYLRNKKAAQSSQWKILRKMTAKNAMEYKFEDPDILYEV